ncbi:hypothetical protein M011DRAFT_250806 [Sporormia fimetaria CBS 119925]|uniref:Uncharacterized protein n=1 Tax=Sporormia fimetaria CBS 119925 TaxID=1340428 RepID=A0A6A6V1H9_9PLEO|nr:hypothetical protein M011DRAFT_250806 [Sporormia fimetaria CBS 119925]
MGASHSNLLGSQGTQLVESATGVPRKEWHARLPNFTLSLNVTIPASPGLAPPSPGNSPSHSTFSIAVDFVRRGKPANTDFRFLDLPPEIRVMIYEEVLVVGNVFFRNRYGQMPPDDHRYRDCNRIPKPELQLLRVSRQIHDEAEPVYLSKNNFLLPVGWERMKPFDIHSSTSSTAPLFSRAGLVHVRYISFIVDQNIRLGHGNVNNSADWRSCEGWMGTKYEDMSLAEIFDWMDDSAREAYHDALMAMADALGRLIPGPRYVEVDYTEAFDYLGRRTILHEDLATILLFRYLNCDNLEQINVLGLRSSLEKVHFNALGIGQQYYDQNDEDGKKMQKIRTLVRFGELEAGE